MKIVGISSLGQSRVIYNQTGIKEAFIEKRALSTLLNGQLLKVVALIPLRDKEVTDR